jgi:hypothetical protein
LPLARVEEGINMLREGAAGVWKIVVSEEASTDHA